MAQFKIGAQVDILIGLFLQGIAVTGKVASDLTVVKGDKDSTDWESLTATTHYTLDEWSVGWYKLSILTGANDTIGELSIKVSSATGLWDTQVYKIDIQTNISSDNYSILSSSTYGNSAINDAISHIGTAGGASVNAPVNTDNASGGITGVTSGTTKVGTQTGTYTNTYNENAIYHVITHNTNAIDWVYQLLCGAGASPVAIIWKGYLVSSNDTITIDMWDHVGGAWETGVAFITGQSPSTTNITKTIPLYDKHAGTSTAELGKVYIRFRCTGMTSPVLNTDQLYLQYAITSRSVGYSEGAVWCDTNAGAGNAGTVSYVNGTADKPCNTWADALTVAAAVGIKRIRIINGSAIQLTATIANYTLVGKNWTLNLNGQSISGLYIDGATVTGTASGTNPIFENCVIGTCQLPSCIIKRSTFSGTVTTVASGTYHFIDCDDGIPGTSNPTFVFAASVTIACRNWRGGINIDSMVATNTIAIDGDFRFVINSNCSANPNGQIWIRGNVDKTDSVSGGFKGTITETAAFNTPNVTGALFTATGVASITVSDADFSPTTTAFEVTEITDATANAYKDCWVKVLTGNNAGEAKRITASSIVTTKVRLTVDTMQAALANGDTLIIF